MSTTVSSSVGRFRSSPVSRVALGSRSVFLLPSCSRRSVDVADVAASTPAGGLVLELCNNDTFARLASSFMKRDLSNAALRRSMSGDGSDGDDGDMKLAA